MFETVPLIIFMVIILAAVIGVVIGHLLSKTSLKGVNGDSNQNFHIDSATGIVSDASSVKYQR
jgi:hypothetical protein